MIYVVVEMDPTYNDSEFPVFASSSKEKAEIKIKQLQGQYQLILELRKFSQDEMSKWMKETAEPIPPTREEKDNYEKLTGKSPSIWVGTGTFGDRTEHILDLEYKSKLHERSRKLDERGKSLRADLEKKHSLREYSIWNREEYEYRILEVESD